jgi:hypothetical protein
MFVSPDPACSGKPTLCLTGGIRRMVGAVTRGGSPRAADRAVDEPFVYLSRIKQPALFGIAHTFSGLRLAVDRATVPMPIAHRVWGNAKNVGELKAVTDHRRASPWWWGSKQPIGG